MKMYLTKLKTKDPTKYCSPLIIENSDGIQLSVGGDDNCGIFENYNRLNIAFFDKDDNHLEDHPLAIKYGMYGSIDVWGQPEVMIKVIGEFIKEKS